MGRKSAENNQSHNFESTIPSTTTLNNWVFERLMLLPPKFSEANARRKIAQMIIRDINQTKFSPEMVVWNSEGAINKLIALGVEKTPKIVDNQDSLHPEEEYQTCFSRNHEENSWSAREVAKNGHVISEAKIFDDGRTILTLNPQGDRYINANPAITDNPNYPRATFTTFDLLVSSIPK